LLAWKTCSVHVPPSGSRIRQVAGVGAQEACWSGQLKIGLLAACTLPFIVMVRSVYGAFARIYLPKHMGKPAGLVTFEKSQV
jgi:hypothetical protein